MMDLYVVHNVQNVMVTDSNPSIRPMTHDAQDPQAVSNLFDSIAYAKCMFFPQIVSFLTMIYY